MSLTYTSKYRHMYFPTTKQELLLKAALLAKEEASVAWKQYGAYINRETIDHASQRILPLLYQNLSSHSIEMKQKEFLQGVYRNFWYSNKLLFNHIQPILHQLQDANIKVMLLKGSALVYDQKYYSSSALRPMSDIDIMVPIDKIPETIEILSSAKYTPKNKKQNILKNSVGNEYLWLRHSDDFVDHEGNSLDLHWHLMTECQNKNIDTLVWQTAEKIRDETDAAPYYVLSPTLQLIHICIHGAKINAMHPLRWVADAYVIIDKSDIDWEALLNFAVQYHLILPLSTMLMYLNNTFTVKIPDHIFKELNQEKVLLVEKAEFYIRDHGKGYRNSICKHFSGLWRYVHGRDSIDSFNGKTKIIYLANYIKYIWRMPSLWLFPLYVLKHAVKFFLRSVKKIVLFLIGRP